MNDLASHILVVDDDIRLRGLLRKYLIENGFRVTTARDADDARAKLSAISFDLIVLDVVMPGENGFQLTAALRETSSVPILLLTARGEPKDRITGLEHGADDYLPKPFAPRELVLRISNLLRRVPDARPETTVRLGAHVFDTERRSLTHGGRAVRLTPVEKRLLRTLARQPGVTLSREELIERSRIAGGARTVDVQVTRLRRKIEPDPRIPRYLQTVRGEGYVLEPD